jgi:hypothetical protein
MLMEKQKLKSKRDALQQRVSLIHQKLEKQKQVCLTSIVIQFSIFVQFTFLLGVMHLAGDSRQRGLQETGRVGAENACQWAKYLHCQRMYAHDPINSLFFLMRSSISLLLFQIRRCVTRA